VQICVLIFQGTWILAEVQNFGFPLLRGSALQLQH